jgi:hypothetical protein
MKQLRIVHVLTFALILTVATGCEKKEETATEVSFSSSGAPAPPPSEAAAAGETTAGSAGDMMLARSLSDEIVAILSDGARIETVSGGTRSVLTVETNDTGKRKYYEPSGAQLVEVKSSDDGFKVRTPDGKLLWKVKLYNDKIKVSDNEENLDAWVFKTTYPEKAKVLDPAGSDFGEVHYAPSPDPVRLSDRSGTDVWTVSGTTGSGAWGAILMEHVPLEQRAIITAELLSRRR